MKEKAVIWIGSSLNDIQKFPQAVKQHIGFALYRAQNGHKHVDAKLMKGLSGVVEIVSRHDKNTYRTVYTIKIRSTVYVVHAFQKKATRGIQTPKKEIDVIKQRLKYVQQLYKKFR
jgi:phage-related protein